MSTRKIFVGLCLIGLMTTGSALQAGNLNGPTHFHDVVQAHSSQVYYFRFCNHECAEITCIGDGDTDLDLYVYDAHGNLVAYDLNYTDHSHVHFFPHCSGYYRVEVRNLGCVWNAFHFDTN